MKKNFRKLAFAITALCVAILHAGATSLQRSDIVGDSAWVVHLDCDKLKPTPVGQYILGEMDKPEAKAKLEGLQALANFDIRTQLHGVTLFGPNRSPEDAVLIIYADFDADHLLKVSKLAPGYQSTDYGKHTIHSWFGDKKGKDSSGHIFATIIGKRVIFGQREHGVQAALDAFDGTKPNLASGKEFSELGTGDGEHLIEAALRKMDVSDSDPNAMILKLSKSIQLILSEKQDKFFGSITLVADNEDVAGRILNIVQGVIALVQFQTDNPGLVKLANSLKIKQDGARIDGKIAVPTSDVVDLLKADAAKKAAEKSDNSDKSDKPDKDSEEKK